MSKFDRSLRGKTARGTEERAGVVRSERGTEGSKKNRHLARGRKRLDLPTKTKKSKKSWIVCLDLCAFLSQPGVELLPAGNTGFRCLIRPNVRDDHACCCQSHLIFQSPPHHGLCVCNSHRWHGHCKVRLMSPFPRSITNLHQLGQSVRALPTGSSLSKPGTLASSPSSQLSRLATAQTPRPTFA